MIQHVRPNTLALSPARSGPASAQEEFSALIGRQGSAPADVARAARNTAEQFVAIALIQPLLKQLRVSNTAAPPFAPSPGEKQFQSLHDAQIAGRIAAAGRFPLVDRLAQDLLRSTGRAGGAAQRVDTAA
ncbi:MAG: hypothetical protein ACK4WH_04130 [Phycisphaerales bacterium]